MGKHFIANFNLNKPKGQNVKFTLQDNSVNATFGISQGGTIDHTKLKNRDLPDQHPISAITNLTQILEEIVRKTNGYIYEQGVSSNAWTIVHNLNKLPSVTVVDEYNRIIDCQVEYIDNNTVIVTFNAAFKGKAYFN